MPRVRSLLGFMLPLALLSVAACSANGDPSDDDSDDALMTDAPLSYVGKNVVQTLTKNGAYAALRGKTWEVSSNNQLDQGWLLPTFGSEWWGEKLSSLPTATDCKAEEPNCDPDFLMRRCDDGVCATGTCEAFAPSVTADGQTPKKMCVGYGDWFEKAFYDAIVSAEEQVDITSLWQPADRFVPAIRNGLLRLAARGKPVTVRILSGDVSSVGPIGVKTGDSIAALTKGLPANSPLKIYVAQHSAALLSWNHSKIVAVDGKSAMVGGHNMHTADYQLKDPVSDLSMKLTGPASALAHRYVNELWDVACERGTLHGFGLQTLPAGLDCPKHYEPKVPVGRGDATVIAAGRMGAVQDNASDGAILSMIDSAKTRVVMSQEDILGGRIPKTNFAAASPPAALLDRLAAAIGRGVDVYLVISNVDGGLFTTSYSHGWTAEETAKQIGDIMKAKTDYFPKGADIAGTLCKKLHVAPIRVSDRERWPDGKVYSNHAKFLMIDTQTFYVGSQNLYSSDLAEFGFIVDSASMSQVAEETFWAPLWKYSGKAASMGSEASTCPLLK